MTDDDCASHVKAAPDEAAKTAAPQGHSRSGDSTPATTTFFNELLNRTRNRRPILAQPAHTAYHLGLLAGAVNPAARKPDENPISYKSAFAAELTTVQALDLHESRIYQKGYTPEEIRHTIKFILRQISPGTIPLHQPDLRSSLGIHRKSVDHGPTMAPRESMSDQPCNTFEPFGFGYLKIRQ
jgi:hypothetical protein